MRGFGGGLLPILPFFWDDASSLLRLWGLPRYPAYAAPHAKQPVRKSLKKVFAIQAYSSL